MCVYVRGGYPLNTLLFTIDTKNRGRGKVTLDVEATCTCKHVNMESWIHIVQELNIDVFMPVVTRAT